MNGSVRVGHVVGVPLRMHWSVPLLVGLFAYGLGHQGLPVWTPGRSDAVYAVAGVAGAALLMGSLLLHETAHAATARRKQISVQDVTLWALGGTTRMGRPQTAAAAFAVAVSGPLISLVIGGVALGAGIGLHELSGWAVPSVVLAWLGWANLFLGVFNLLPAVPLDGGGWCRRCCGGAPGTGTVRIWRPHGAARSWGCCWWPPAGSPCSAGRRAGCGSSSSVSSS